MNIQNHLLRDNNIAVENSPNQGGELLPDTIVIHYTAGPSATSAIREMMNRERKVSAHLVVDLDGSITQLVPFNRIAWHAGKSRHKDRVNLNRFSIGIEIVNAGRLDKTGSTYTSWFGRKYPEEEVFIGIHRNEDFLTAWHRYTEEQITVTGDLCELLVSHYNISFILGHEEISPGRKIDPGPAFPLDKLRDRILNLDPRDEDAGEDEVVEEPGEGMVTASKLNIRSNPTISQNLVAKPLPRGTKVTILKRKNGWYKVSTTIEGWVSSKFIKGR